MKVRDLTVTQLCALIFKRIRPKLLEAVAAAAQADQRAERAHERLDNLKLRAELRGLAERLEALERAQRVETLTVRLNADAEAIKAAIAELEEDFSRASEVFTCATCKHFLEFARFMTRLYVERKQ